MATPGLYRRVLPSPPAIEFASPQGKSHIFLHCLLHQRLQTSRRHLLSTQLFAEALQGGTMEGFFKLISYFQTQSEPAYCGLASISMVLNALAIDPGRKWKGPWRWFDESMLDCCEPLEKIRNEGITFAKVACLAVCNGANVEALRTNQCTMDDFRQHIVACSSTEGFHVITSYHRATFKQTGSGHFSPIGGYHTGRDMVLILDVARFKYPPHWVPLALLWEAMDTVDEATHFQRGFMVISRPQTATSLLYTLSCKDDSWATTAKKLIDDIPILLRSDDVKDVQKVLSVVFKSLPNNFWELIKLIVEVRREETDDSILSREERGRLHVKEEVLKLVKETKLFQQVMEWMCSASLCCTNIPSKADNSTSLDTAPSGLFQEAESLTKNIDLLYRFSHTSTSNTCNVDMPSVKVSRTERTCRSEERMNMLVPSCETNSSSFPANCIETRDARGDGLTALLLALPPHTWLGIKDEKLLEEMCSFVSTESFPPLLQEEVLYLRKQLQFLRKCLDDELEAPSCT